MKEQSIIKAWDKLNEINNKIELKTTLLATKTGIKSNRLKEIMVQCSFGNNDAFINSIIARNELGKELRKLYISKNAYETYIYKEIERTKLSTPALCIAFLKEYKKLTWRKVAKEMKYSVAQCRRYYDEYLGKTPKDNTWIKE